MKRTAEAAGQRLAAGLDALGLSGELATPLMEYLSELQHWNRAYNLTAVRDPEEMVSRHVLDCLSLLPALSGQAIEPAPMLDVGSGAGLPGLILAIAHPAWEIHVLDSNGKKARFLRHVQRKMKLDNVRVIEARVESHHCRTRYASITSRAFASLQEFFAATRHLLAPDGFWLAMRGRVDDNEASSLGPYASAGRVVPLHVPGLVEDRHLVIASPS